jgi:hypothetical protein
MKILLCVVALFLTGCGDLLDGIRIGTDESVDVTAAENRAFQAVFRPADFARFPGDRDSIVASASVGAGPELAIPTSSTPLLLSLWNRDSSVGAWVRDPTSRFPQTRASQAVAIELTDSVTHRTFELSVAGTGIASTGSRIDSTRTRYRLRSPGEKVALAVRWSVGSSWKIVFIDSVALDRDRNIDVSGWLESPSGTRVRMDSAGAIARSTDGN